MTCGDNAIECGFCSGGKGRSPGQGICSRSSNLLPGEHLGLAKMAHGREEPYGENTEQRKKNEAGEDMETGDTAKSRTQSGPPPEHGTTPTDFLNQVAPLGLQSLEPREPHLVTTDEVELRPVFPRHGRTYSVFTADPAKGWGKVLTCGPNAIECAFCHRRLGRRGMTSYATPPGLAAVPRIGFQA